MKIKVSNTMLKNNYFCMFRAGYCDLHNIMQGVEPDFYNAGVYGWNFDAYESPDGVAVISTGYRNMLGERIPSEILNKYDKKARAINARYDWKDYEKKQKAHEKNRAKFWAELEQLSKDF